MKTQQSAEAQLKKLMDQHFAAMTKVADRIQKLQLLIEVEERKEGALRDKYIERRKKYDDELSKQLWRKLPHLCDRADGVKGHFCISRQNPKMSHFEFWNEDTLPGKWMWPGTLYKGTDVAQAKLDEILKEQYGSN